VFSKHNPKLEILGCDIPALEFRCPWIYKGGEGRVREMKRGREREMERVVPAPPSLPSTGSGHHPPDLAALHRIESIGRRTPAIEEASPQDMRAPPWPPVAWAPGHMQWRRAHMPPPVPEEGERVKRHGPERSQSRRRVGDTMLGEGETAAMRAWRGSGGCCFALGVASAWEKWKESQALRKSRA
jgi:hypothetical protein